MMKQTGPPKSERIAGIALSLFFVAGTIMFAAFYRSVFSIVYTVCVAILIPIAILRSRKVDQKAMIVRLDKETVTKDSEKSDPREMARWVP